MSVESGCLVFCSSRGDDAWCYYSLNACIPFIAWFLFWFFFLPNVIQTWSHSIFGISVSSHVTLRYMQHAA